MTHLELVAQRQADPALLTDAQMRADAIADRIRKTAINTVAQMAQDAQEPAHKAFYMHLVLDTLAKATEGIVPCKSGCSHCCNMATLITAQEAQALAKASGRDMTMPSSDKFNRLEDEDVRIYNGVACPFLIENKCSVYASRPHACRVHYSLDRDNLLCQIVPGKEIRTPTLNTMQYTMLSVAIQGNPLDLKYADIREFFPTKGPKK